ncbi:hypothetical protein [Emticicia sp. C21]|uniref:hypothetical protein n=1 Tax=Emticicia sp. C21 TaxID=2302915 RepID=UPI000E344409|nr:hypothetical protein [Emticicia sp. C21]RFS17175.1 hypothetical protein D0T08_05150 [Emticicia sp. C21]
MKISVIIITILAIASIIIFNSFRTRVSSTIKNVAHGPFTIQMEKFSTRSYNMNYGMVTNVSIKYSVLYKGNQVQFSKNLQNNTGYSHIWRVYILADAPTPTLIAGSQSLYLIREENGSVVVKPLDEQGYDFASLQFLDPDKGQPAKSFKVFMANDQDGDGKVDSLKGGDYLLVNQHTVLHIPTLKKYVMNKNNNLVDNYSFYNDAGAIAFSPDKKWIAFTGDFATYNTNDEPKYENAIVVYNYERDKGYTVPFSKINTRLKNQFYINRTWFETYFEWIEQNGVYTLQLKKLTKQPYWQGAYEDEGKVYEINYAKPEIQKTLIDFILKRYNLSADTIKPGDEYSTDELNIMVNGLKLAVWYRKDDRQLIFMKNIYAPESEAYIPMIHEIGDAFNKALSEGKYQNHFIED